MKKLKLTLSALLFAALAMTAYAQTSCSGALLSDDFSNPALWTTLGAYSQPIPGSIGISGGSVNYVAYRGRQTRRLVRNVSSALPNNNLWRIEWDFIETGSPFLNGGMLMAVTSTNQHPRFAVPATPPETNQNTIEVLLGNPLSGGQSRFVVTSKFGTTRTMEPNVIWMNNNVQYYMRLQRTSPGQAVFSVFSDPARTNHVAGSPVCFQIDSRIDQLGFLQQGVYSSSSQNRTLTANTDNLCIYDNIIDEGCEPRGCEINPKLAYLVDRNTCTVTFVDNTTYGPGTTPLAGFPIIFGDGTTGTIPPGGSVSHAYPSGGFQACMMVFAYDQNFECCREKVCVEFEIECKPKEKAKRNSAPAQNDVELFPNPSHNLLQVQSEKAIQGLRIYDLSGKTIRTEKDLNQNYLKLDLEKFQNGVYFLELNLGNEVVTKKFSKL